MATYTESDIDPLVEMFEKTKFLEFICKMKHAFPYCTLTEIGFSPGCAKKVHEVRHYVKAGNLPYFGYSQKEREDEIQIFKKRFNSFKKEKLKQLGIKFKESGVNVKEFYLPLEEWISPILFTLSPRLKLVYENISNDEKIAFLQYLKAFARDVFVDSYFAEKERDEFETAEKLSYNNREKYYSDVNVTIGLIDFNSKNSFSTAFKNLKNIFRSIYVSISGKERSKIRPTKKSVEELKLVNYLVDEADLYLLKQNASEISLNLPEKSQHNIKRFLSTFNTFENIWGNLEDKLKENVEFPRALPYIRMREERAKFYERMFYARYGFNFNVLKKMTDEAYINLGKSLDSSEIIDVKGDYLFVESEKDIPNTYTVRTFERYP
ncbi:hypothetical protein HY498_01315 [Candidatus Woesearchaeota archaeon]|nr:hypothetical protein [Candidatus Woesearchaeota archaeon]